VSTLVSYVQKNLKVLVDAEVISIVTLGVAPYANEKFKQNFRLNSFFISESTRGALNSTAADYTPAFLSSVPRLIKTGRIPLNVALIQTSPPDCNGNPNLGIGVDITRAAMESASMVISQINSHMPRVQGDGVISMDPASILPFLGTSPSWSTWRPFLERRQRR
jgi:acyl-CoA hydrolase